MSKGFLRLRDSLYLTREQCQEICIYAHRVCSTGSMLLCSTRAVPAVNTCNCQCTSGMKEVDCIATRYTRHGIHMMWVCVCVGVFHALIFAVADRKHRERPQVGSVVAGAIRIITFTLSISKYFSAMLIITISQGM